MWSLRTELYNKLILRTNKHKQTKTVMHHHYIELLVQNTMFIHSAYWQFEVGLSDLLRGYVHLRPTLLNKLLIWAKICLFKKYLNTIWTDHVISAVDFYILRVCRSLWPRVTFFLHEGMIPCHMLTNQTRRGECHRGPLWNRCVTDSDLLIC